MTTVYFESETTQQGDEYVFAYKVLTNNTDVRLTCAYLPWTSDKEVLVRKHIVLPHWLVRMTNFLENQNDPLVRKIMQKMKDAIMNELEIQL